MVSSGETVIEGEGLTVIVNCTVEEQPKENPVTVYVVLDVGLAVTLEPVDELNDDDGLHK
jgi:hypothetical protein